MKPIRQTLLRALFTILFLLLGVLPVAQALPQIDQTPRIAVMSAFEPELALLLRKVKHPRKFSVNGVEFTTGSLQGHPVVLFLSGISMTNAAMNTQLVLDRFKISHIVFSGIAGGANPDLHIGDVTVAAHWGQYLEVLMARETAPGVFAPVPGKLLSGMSNFGMMYPRPVRVRSAMHPQISEKFWFDVDPKMLAVAQKIRNVKLAACDISKKCLSRTPELVVGGNGVSGSAFVDNAAYREYVFKTFHANVIDMESAACAMVAYSNGVPFIAFRSLSDLAGGGEGANEMRTFMRIAADNSARVLLAFLAAWK
ncbi:MAG: phosphorylase [Candidimonas sp.]|nr:MAG: phosphorylase [Candidimonas sp.]TAM26124.1 MAG: phosphorylase [Candidimonas sp.]TAM74167.1 MAG: phosphorylase [Candidimonas sp.]